MWKRKNQTIRKERNDAGVRRGGEPTASNQPRENGGRGRDDDDGGGGGDPFKVDFIDGKTIEILLSLSVANA